MLFLAWSTSKRKLGTAYEQSDVEKLYSFTKGTDFHGECCTIMWGDKKTLRKIMVGLCWEQGEAFSCLREEDRTWRNMLVAYGQQIHSNLISRLNHLEGMSPLENILHWTWWSRDSEHVCMISLQLCRWSW